MIIEQTYGLSLLWDELVEPPGTRILGALCQRKRQIVLNERHRELFDNCIGPERFTLAHELAHWIYDADDVEQQLLPLGGTGFPDSFCYDRETAGLAEVRRIREMNANKLASHLLMPEHLVREATLDAVLADPRSTAAAWGVSQTSLRIRLETLGLIGPQRASLFFPA
jgi:Zn-dependent peptidase ImmA (M78 family)